MKKPVTEKEEVVNTELDVAVEEKVEEVVSTELDVTIDEPKQEVIEVSDKKATKKIFNSCLALALLFFIPLLVTVTLNMVGTPTINEYDGLKVPQITIKDLEVVNVTTESLVDLFDDLDDEEDVW